MVMKKILIALVFAITAIGAGFAQDYSDIEGFSDFMASGESSSGIGLRAGVYGGFQPTIGGLSEFVFGTMGGGVGVEYDIITIPDTDIAVGASVHAGANIGFIKSDLISSLVNVQAFGGAYVRIPIGMSGFIIQPGLEYGITANFPKVNEEYPGNELKSCYWDQTVQAAVSVRYSPAALDGLLEFEAAPVYTLCTEKSEVLHYIGVRIGVMVNF